jgi:glycosyltransferase involved in cell wall biosynthesis
MGGIFVKEHAKAVQLFDEVRVLHSTGSPVAKRKKEHVWKQEINDELIKDVPTYRLNYRFSPIPGVSFLRKIQVHRQFFQQIIDEGFRPDIIHAHIYHSGIVGVILGKLYRIPVVVTEQSSVFGRKLLPKYGIWQAKFAFERAHLVLPVSYALQQHIAAYGIRGRFQCVPNVVDTSVFHYNAAPKLDRPNLRFMFAGSLVPVKGIPNLLKALKIVDTYYQNWRLDIVGDGPNQQEYQQLAYKLNIHEKIHWHGYRTKEFIASMMRQVDFFVLSSLYETFSAVSIEALASGLPVLATRCGGPSEFINDNNGFLVKPDDVEDLAKGIQWMFKNRDKFDRVNISANAHTSFSFEAIGQTLHDIYKSVVERNPK